MRDKNEKNICRNCGRVYMAIERREGLINCSLKCSKEYRLLCSKWEYKMWAGAKAVIEGKKSDFFNKHILKLCKNCRKLFDTTKTGFNAPVCSEQCKEEYVEKN